MIWRRLLWLMIPLILFLPLVLVVVAALPPEYEAVCTFAVLESAPDGPNARQPVQRITSQQFLHAKYGILDGSNLLGVISDLRLDQYRIADTSARALISRVRRKLSWLEPKPIGETQLIERLMEQFQDRIRVERSGKNRIAVRYRGTDDEFNARLVNATVQGFIEDSARRRPAPSRMNLELLEKRIVQHRARMEESRRRINEFRAQCLVDPAAEIEHVRSALDRDKNELETARRNLKALSSELTTMETQIASFEKRQPSKSAEEAERRIALLKQSIARMEVQLSEMKATLTDKNPRVIVLENTIAELRKELGSEERELVADNTHRPEPALEKLLVRKRELAAEKDRVRARIDSLSANVRDGEGRVRSLSADQRHIDDLTREHELNRELYTSYLKRLASVPADVEHSPTTLWVESYEIVEKAYAGGIPVGPDRGRLAAFGTLLAVVVCLAMTVMMKLVGRGLYRTAEVPASTEMPGTLQPGAAAGRLERRRTVKRAAWYALLTMVYCLAIFAISSIARPPDALKWIGKHDLAAHAVLYAGLGWLVGMTVRAGAIRLRTWQYWIVPIAFVALYGATDEFHEWLVPGRDCALTDWVADVVAGVAVQLVFPLHARWRRRTRK